MGSLADGIVFGSPCTLSTALVPSGAVLIAAVAGEDDRDLHAGALVDDGRGDHRAVAEERGRQNRGVNEIECCSSRMGRGTAPAGMYRPREFQIKS